MSATPQRIYITGGRGRLASLVTDHFRAPANRITLFSRRDAPGFRPLNDLLAESVLAEGDIILHLGWSTLPATAEDAVAALHASDFDLLNRLLDGLAAQPAGSRPHLVFFSSGGAVYGNAPGRASRENDPCQPVGAYGRAKLRAEEMIRARVADLDNAATILRIANPYGYPVPAQRPQGLIPHALHCAIESRPLTLWGNGTALKDYLYYTDFLSALEHVVARRLPGTFNLGSGVSHSVREIIALVEQYTEQSLSVRYEPAPAWDVQDSRLDVARFVRATDWQPQVTLNEGIRRAAGGY